MALNLRNPQVDRLVDELARLTGETKTDAVLNSVRDRLERVRRERRGRRLADELDEIALRCAALPSLDARSDDQILGYGEDGLPR
jgi:antitoxin VapB